MDEMKPETKKDAVPRKIVFLFPWREVSGGPVYFANLAEALAKRHEYEVYYIDYADGVARASSRKDIGIRWITYEEPFSMPIHDPVLLIVPIYCAPHIPTLHPDSKILFINWHNYCIPALGDCWRLNDRELQQFLSMVYRTNSVAFLDRAHWLAQNSFVRPEGAYRFRQEYIPAVFAGAAREEGVRPRCDGAVSVAVLGRICEDKVFAIINLAEQLDLVKTPLEKHLYVIGSGSEAQRLIDRCGSLQVKLHMVGTLRGECLKQFLQEKADILFGMGLSILEGAALAIPSVIIPHNICPFQLNQFAFLQDSDGYALGWYDTQSDDMRIRMHSLQEIVDSVYGEDDQKKALGTAAYAHLKAEHMDNCDAAIAAMRDTTLCYSEFLRFSRSVGLLRIAGIPIGRITSSFTGDTKSLSILGIQNLFTCRISGTQREFYVMGRRQSCLKAEKINGKYRLTICGKTVPFIKL